MDIAARLGAARKLAWSPDGSALAFQSDRAGDWETYAINLDGTGERRRTTGDTNEQRVAWRPE